MQTRNALMLLVGIAVFTFVPASTSHADKNPQKFTISISGTDVDIPLDLDADSCTTSVGVTVCTDFSAEFTSGGKEPAPSRAITPAKLSRSSIPYPEAVAQSSVHPCRSQVAPSRVVARRVASSKRPAQRSSRVITPPATCSSRPNRPQSASTCRVRLRSTLLPTLTEQ
jgi:hypothetical protein